MDKIDRACKLACSFTDIPVIEYQNLAKRKLEDVAFVLTDELHLAIWLIGYYQCELDFMHDLLPGGKG